MSVLVSIVSSLGGYEGSNPKLEKLYPVDGWAGENEIIQKSLPYGATPDTFFQEKLNGKNILVYTFEIQVEGKRNDLVSIGFALGKDAIVEDLKIVIKFLIRFLEEKKALKIDILKNNLPEIMISFNKHVAVEIKIQDGRIIKFNLPKLLKLKKIKLKKSARKVKGGLL